MITFFVDMAIKRALYIEDSAKVGTRECSASIWQAHAKQINCQANIAHVVWNGEFDLSLYTEVGPLTYTPYNSLFLIPNSAHQ